MAEEIILHVNGKTHHLQVDPETPLLYVLRNDLYLKGVKSGCASEQCGACKVLIDGQAVPCCQLPVQQAAGLEITTIEGLGTESALHPLQEAFIEEQAIQCGYCVSGMIIAAQGLLNRVRYPTNDQIREALAENLCRCGTHERIRRAIRLRIGRPDQEPLYTVQTRTDGDAPPPSAELPRSFLGSPELDAWVRINTDETITIFSGKVELGQGIRTALAQIAADELDVDIARIRMAPTDTNYSPNEGLTVGSMSLETSGNAIRWASAEARQILLSIAYEELEAPLERLVVRDGRISDPATGRATTYWDLYGGQLFHRQVSGIGKPKSSKKHTTLGQAVKRLDLPAKVTGQPVFVQDLTLPGMVHGRVVRPPHYAARLVGYADSAAALPGVLKIVRNGSFLGVIAAEEIQAVRAMEALRESAVWEGTPDFPPQEQLAAHLTTEPTISYPVVDGTTVDEPVPPIRPPASAARTVTASYFRPYHMHASLSPAAAVAHLAEGKLTIWTHSQGVYPIRTALAPVLELPEDQIRVIQMESSGCYGHNGADDAALDAALLALAYPGAPISLKWTREDDLAWEPYGPAMAAQLQGSLGADGQVIDWNHDIWTYPHMGRPRSDARATDLVAAWHLENPYAKPPRFPFHAPHIGGHRNADPLYTFPQRRIVKHFVQNTPLRTSSMRGLGAYANVFAIESFMDELAHAAGIDPVEFRLRHLADPRARAVIAAAAEKAGWDRPKTTHPGFGRGVAFAQYKNRQCYAAVVIELYVNPQTGAIQLSRAVIAGDAGQIVNPDGLSNQLEGGLIQAASWTLKEQVTFDHTGITSRDWETYPILRFPEVPKLETVLLNRPDQPFLGTGEATQGPTPAAIANAVFDATGVRLRQIPFTPEVVLQALRGIEH